ncbi:MAG: hypothetical protein ACHQUB_02630 [Candidatus Saccharimonadia bacterium]
MNYRRLLGVPDVRKLVRWLTIATLIAALLPILPAQAAQITSRKLTIGTSLGNAATTWNFSFTVPTTGTTLRGMRFEVCTTASGTCTVPTGWVNTGATLASQPTNAGTGWTIDLSTYSDSLGITTGSSQSITGGGVLAVNFNTVTNPNTTNTTWYVRISTYNGASYTTQVDTGTVTASTATQIVVSGTMPESLIFCTGTSITGTNCATITGSTVALGFFSPTSTVYGTSIIGASTNAGSGYVITVNGATLTSGANTIPAMGSATTSNVGTGQFGLNLVANTSPSVGTAVSGPGTSTAFTNYDTVNNFKFTTGDTVATSGGAASDVNVFTVSYIANVAGNQATGNYTSTLTYICTATF